MTKTPHHVSTSDLHMSRSQAGPAEDLMISVPSLEVERSAAR
jgi:hypothetical protein